VNDVSTTPLGLVIAAVSVVSSGLQQIMCGAIQAKYKVSSHQLLSNTAPAQVGVAGGARLQVATHLPLAHVGVMHCPIKQPCSSRGMLSC
jgi:hypothetical protein